MSLAAAIPTPLASTTRAMALLPDWLNPEHILQLLGPYVLIGCILIIFAECGLLVGFFLPGDSLLFTAGLFVANGYIDLPLWVLAASLTAAGVLGNMVGYEIGRALGPAVFNRPNSRLFKKEYVDKTHEFFERFGGRAIVLARFVPIVRTFITVMAGAGKMPRSKYFGYSLIGGVLWASGVTVLGYYLGQVAFIRGNVEVIFLVIVLVSVVPIGIEYLNSRRRSRSKLRAES